MVTNAISKTPGCENGFFDLPVPREFDFLKCLQFLNRNPQECLHTVEDNSWSKLLVLENHEVIIQVSMASDKLRICSLNTPMTSAQQGQAAAYVAEVLDLSCDLRPFYQHIKHDPLIYPITKAHFGLRLIGIPELFEALCWSIIGQQINLTFAYRLKQRLVRAKGKKLQFGGDDYYLFPNPEVIAAMAPEEFSQWQYSASKARYLIGIAREIDQGNLSKEDLLQMSGEQALSTLTALVGVGPWSANYVMMKCLRISSAYPATDIGLQNAIKIQLGLQQKPSKAMLEKLGERWHPWQSYATFYLWHSLIK